LPDVWLTLQFEHTYQLLIAIRNTYTTGLEVDEKHKHIYAEYLLSKVFLIKRFFCNLIYVLEKLRVRHTCYSSKQTVGYIDVTHGIAVNIQWDPLTLHMV